MFTCLACGAEFEIVVNAPTVNYEHPSYCPYCGESLDNAEYDAGNT